MTYMLVKVIYVIDTQKIIWIADPILHRLRLNYNYYATEWIHSFIPHKK